MFVIRSQHRVAVSSMALIGLLAATAPQVIAQVEESPVQPTAKAAESGPQVFVTPYRLAADLSDPDSGPEWSTVRREVHGVWMNGAGSTADEVSGMLALLDADEYPVILPGACSVSASGVTCGTDSSRRRTEAANARLGDVGKRLVPIDRAFNLAPALGEAPIEDIVDAINAAEQDPDFDAVRSGILVHPRDGLDANFADTMLAIDAVDDGGVVAVEVSASLLDASNRLEGMANVFRYAQDQGKQAVWLVNGARGDRTQWITNLAAALDFWEQRHDLVPDIIAPIATIDADMAVLPEGDGSWPPAETWTSIMHSLLLRGADGPGNAAPPTPPPSGIHAPAAASVRAVPIPATRAGG